MNIAPFRLKPFFLKSLFPFLRKRIKIEPKSDFSFFQHQNENYYGDDDDNNNNINKHNN